MKLPSYFRRIYEASEINSAVDRLADEITPWAIEVHERDGQELVVVPILRGGMVFFSDLVRRIPHPVEWRPVQVNAYTDNTQGVPRPDITTNLMGFDAKGRSVLLVDEICDSGRTYNEVQDLLRRDGAKEIRSVALIKRIVDNPKHAPTYVGFTYHGAEWLAGYGLKGGGHYGNLPEIYAIRKDGENQSKDQTQTPRSSTSSDSPFDIPCLKESVEVLRKKFQGINLSSGCAMVLGTGWAIPQGSSLAALGLDLREEISFEEIPALCGGGVSGHASRISWATAGNREFLVFQGRRHWFELNGQDLTPLLAIPYITGNLGASTLLMTQGVGGIGKDLNSGDYAIVTDHLGPDDMNAFPGAMPDFFREEFPVCTKLYSERLGNLLAHALEECGLSPRGAIYRFSPARQFQTPALIRKYKAEGANLVGKSGFFESMYASQLGLEFASIALILNKAAGEAEEGPDHELHKRVGIEAAATSHRILKAFIKGFKPGGRGES